MLAPAPEHGRPHPRLLPPPESPDRELSRHFLAWLALLDLLRPDDLVGRFPDPQDRERDRPSALYIPRSVFVVGHGRLISSTCALSDAVRMLLLLLVTGFPARDVALHSRRSSAPDSLRRGNGLFLHRSRRASPTSGRCISCSCRPGSSLTPIVYHPGDRAAAVPVRPVAEPDVLPGSRPSGGRSTTAFCPRRSLSSLPPRFRALPCCWPGDHTSAAIRLTSALLPVSANAVARHKRLVDAPRRRGRLLVGTQPLLPLTGRTGPSPVARVAGAGCQEPLECCAALSHRLEAGPPPGLKRR